MYRHLFGPVPSRRLGLSLGLDLLNDQTCSFDCVFCEVGKTRDLTIDRREYVAPSEILDELESWVSAGGRADYITLAGRGEPTLNTGFGEVIRGARKITQTPVAMLSNGSLFFIEDVRNNARDADVVKLSLGAWNQESMERLNRPCKELQFERIVEGYGIFRSIFKGELWIEVLLVEGINDHVEGVEQIAEIVSGIGPDRVHINTVVRPPAERSAHGVGFEKMEVFAKLFDPVAEVVVSSKGLRGDSTSVKEMLLRRPCTLSDMFKVTGISSDSLIKLLELHRADWGIVSRNVGGETYYLIETRAKDAK